MSYPRVNLLLTCWGGPCDGQEVVLHWGCGTYQPDGYTGDMIYAFRIDEHRGPRLEWVKR